MLTPLRIHSLNSSNIELGLRLLQWNIGHFLTGTFGLWTKSLMAFAKSDIWRLDSFQSTIDRDDVLMEPGRGEERSPRVNSTGVFPRLFLAGEVADRERGPCRLGTYCVGR